MIDVENLVFDTVFNGVRNVYADLEVTKGFVEETATFPCIVVRETNNVPVQNMNTDDCAENYTRVTYQIDIYSDRAGTARSENRELMKLVDDIMQGMKFYRTYMSEPLNIKRTIFRQYARYTAIIGKGITTGETTTFQVYRR
jgi:hypothetical protein